MTADRFHRGGQRARVGAVRVDDPDRRAGLRAVAVGRHIAVLVGLIRDAPAVGRPGRARADRRELFRGAASCGDHPDAAMAQRVIGDQLPVGRPRRLHVLTAVAGERRFGGAAAKTANEQLEPAAAIGDEGDRITLRRDRRMHVESRVRSDLHGPLRIS